MLFRLYFINILLLFLNVCFLICVAYSETVKDPVLLKCNIATYTASTFLAVFGAYATFYYHYYCTNSFVISIIGLVLIIWVLFILIILLYWEIYWFRLVAIRQKTCMISYARLSFSERKYIFIIIPNTALFLYRGIWFLLYAVRNRVNYWGDELDCGLQCAVSVHGHDIK